MEISMTDMRRAVKYLEDAATLYDTQKGQRNRCRAWVIRQLTAKMQRRSASQFFDEVDAYLSLDNRQAETTTTRTTI